MDLRSLSLADLYREYRLADQAGDYDRTDEVADVAAERSFHAARLIRLTLGYLSDQDLVEYAVRVRQPPPGSRRNEDQQSARFEFLRVQASEVETEIVRRRTFHENFLSGLVYAPTHGEMLGSLMRYSQSLTGPDPDPGAEITLLEAEKLIPRLLQDDSSGRDFLYTLLARISSLPDPVPGGHPSLPWIKAAVVLELITNPYGFAHRERPSVPPAALAESLRAKRILLGSDRQGQRFRDSSDQRSDWELDLDPTTVATWIHEANRAWEYWHRYGISLADLREYLTPPPNLEPGRPPAPPQIVSREEALERARSAGGVIEPMLYPLAANIRRDAARHIWTHGIPPLPSGEQGWAVYGLPQDIRMGGGTLPHPDGIRVCFVASPGRILSIGRPQDHQNEDLLEDMKIQAERGSAEMGPTFRRRLRALLIARGYLAIARYDYVDLSTPTPQELIVLEPSALYLLVIRESIPLFIHPPELDRVLRRV